MNTLQYVKLLLTGLFLLGVHQAAQAQNDERPRSAEVRTGDEAFDSGRYEDAIAAYRRGCKKNIGQACQRAGRFYDYEGAGLRKKRANPASAIHHFIKACAILRDRKACDIVRAKATKTKEEINQLLRAPKPDRALIQSTLSSRYADLAGYEVAQGFDRTGFIRALEKNVHHAERAARRTPNSKSRAEKLRIAKKRLALHKAVRNLPAAYDPTPNCRLLTPIRGNVRSQLKYINDWQKCLLNSRGEQFQAYANAARVGGISLPPLAEETFQITPLENGLNWTECLCYWMFYQKRDSLVEKINSVFARRSREIDRRGLQRYYSGG